MSSSKCKDNAYSQGKLEFLVPYNQCIGYYTLQWILQVISE